MVTTTDKDVSAHLSALADTLARTGLCARITQPIGRPPSLHVLNPDMPALEEHIVLDRGENGTLWFSWAWAGEPIAPAARLEDATATIRRVVGAH